jgi:hypothetical protein
MMEYTIWEWALAVVFWGWLAVMVVGQCLAILAAIVSIFDGSAAKDPPWVGGAGSADPF